MAKRLTIMIGTRNRLEILRKCLNALITGNESKYEVVVMDAGSTDGSLDYLKNLSTISLVCDGKPIGQARSLNDELRQVHTGLVCYISHDNVVQNEMMDVAVNILETDRNIGMVGLKTKDVTGPHIAEPYIGGIWASGVLNCNQAVLPTEVLVRLGGFSEDFMDYGIDADLTTKVLQAGYAVVYTKRVAIHHYRDHGIMSWTDPEGRTRRVRAALELYHARYGELIDCMNGGRLSRISSRAKLRIAEVVRGVYRIADRAGIPLEQVIGYNARDWGNFIQCPFISWLDPIRSRNRAYYLVQKLPGQSTGFSS